MWFLHKYLKINKLRDFSQKQQCVRLRIFAIILYLIGIKQLTATIILLFGKYCFL